MILGLAASLLSAFFWDSVRIVGGTHRRYYSVARVAHRVIAAPFFCKLPAAYLTYAQSRFVFVRSARRLRGLAVGGVDLAAGHRARIVDD